MPLRRGVPIGVAIGIALALSSCGWAPLYADPETGPASEELRAVEVDPISAGRIGQRLEIALRNSLNPSGEPTPPRYRLQSVLATNLTNLGIQSQGLATLGKLDVAVTYYLSDIHSGADLLVNTVHVANTFDLNPNQYSTTVGEDDAAVRGVAELDQEIVTRLTLFFQRRLAEQKAKPG
jgi:LPS-assembly lipoprotein